MLLEMQNISEIIEQYFPIKDKNFRIRPAQTGDFQKGHVSLLAQLTEVGEYGPDEYQEFLDYIEKRRCTYYLIVVEDIDSKRIVGSGTLLIEQKLIHKLGRVGHIEDIVVDKEYRGFGLGKLIIQNLKTKAKGMACYKMLLDCDRDNVGFYKRCEFIENGVEMRNNL